MNVRKLQIFLTVCELGSMSATAKKLYMTQPAISQTISELETELGVKLFERMNKKLILTFPGKVFKTYSKRILTLVEEAEYTLKEIAHMNLGKLMIGASTTIGIYLLPDLIGKYREKQQNIDISFIIDNTSIIEEMLLDNQIDIGLIEGPIHSEDIIVEPYFEDELYLICSKNHPFAFKGAIEIEELQKADLIIREKGSGTREVFENIMSKYNQSYRYKHVLNNTEAIKKAVEANIGVAIVSKVAISDELKTNKLMKVDVKDVQFKRPFNIIFHKDKYRSPLFNDFLSFLRDKKSYIRNL